MLCPNWGPLQGSTPACRDEVTVLACRRNGSTPEQCGCHNGNAAMGNLTGYLRELGFKFGMYSSAGVVACDGAAGTSQGFERQDAELFVREWQSEYVMIDSCGVKPRAPPYGPAPGPGAVDQGRWELTKWHALLAAEQAAGANPVALHDCHVGCASAFGGPTLGLAPCNATSPAQQWGFDGAGNYTSLVDQERGLCVGCGGDPSSACGGASNNASAPGLGMQYHGFDIVLLLFWATLHTHPHHSSPFRPRMFRAMCSGGGGVGCRQAGERPWLKNLAD